METSGQPQEAKKKQPSKTLYLDKMSIQALDFLKANVPKGGMRFSNSALFREMLDSLRADPAGMLEVERYPGRGVERGRFVCVPLAEEDLTLIGELDAYYQERAEGRYRVRDKVPKSKHLPISQLYAAYVRSQATKRGWQPS